MGRRPCCEKVGLKKGSWSAEEDNKLINFILTNAHCCWRAVPKQAGLLRCGKSCRLRWTNYLRPDLKRGLLSEHEENLLIHLHAKLGNKWSKIASQLPGRTDNEIKNHWNTYIKKKLKKMGIDPATHKPLSTAIEQPQQPSKNQQQVVNESKEISNNLLEGEEKSKMVAASSTSLFEFEPKYTIMEQANFNNNGFCIDEVPLIQPHEIHIQLPPTNTNFPLSSPSSSSSSSLSSSLVCNNDDNNQMVGEGMHQVFQKFDWQLFEDYISLSSLWDDDDLIKLDPSYFSSIDNNTDITLPWNGLT